ncbi:Voltage-gated Ion Channel (VIC) Superfamily [Thraustotheca clavata]|uniref:Voltage-gated Ion Channel (VIC) Superfamily n=1 Tax=Thraustotheca clavata TaxID=74557 RepID=A0A1V9ZEZ0_9STRA|nr:Voltage-gated Ion Channel (VIC) Superfamily [Thraustotheca clavata]
MGSGASKAGSAVATTSRKIIRTKLTREEIFAFGRNGYRPRTTELQEMNEKLLHDAQRFDELEKVQMLEMDVEGFNQTASARRQRSDGPVPMPKDKSWNSNSTTLVSDEPGRFTDLQFRELLRLYRENPTEETISKLATKFQANPIVVENIVNHCSPPQSEYDTNDVIARTTHRTNVRRAISYRKYSGIYKWRARIRRFMNEPTSSVWAALYNYFMIFNIVANFMPWMLETMDGPNHTPGDPGTCVDCDYPMLFRDQTYQLWNAAYTLLFTIEYIVCLVVTKSQRYFWSRWRTIFDILALLPSYCIIYRRYQGLGDFKYQNYLNMLRMGRNFRIAYMLRDIPGIKILKTTIDQCIPPLQVTVKIMLFATTLYYVQPCYNRATCTFSDVFNAGYFVMTTVATVGYGDQTVDINNPLALLVDIIVMIFGTLYLSMPFAVIGVRYQIAWRHHEIRARRPNDCSKSTITIRPVESITLNMFAHKATRHYLDLCSDFAYFSKLIDDLMEIVPDEILHGHHHKYHHDLLTDTIKHAKTVMVLFHHNAQDVKAFEPKQNENNHHENLVEKTRNAIRRSIVEIEKPFVKAIHVFEIGSWRHKLSQLLENPDESMLGRFINKLFFIMALSSVLVFYAETTPEFQEFGPLSPLCQQTFNIYCNLRYDYSVDPGCYVQNATGVVIPAQMVDFYCSISNPVVNTTSLCFGQGYNYGSNSTKKPCYDQFYDVGKICTIRQCQSGHKPLFDMSMLWIYFEWGFGIVFSIEIFIRYLVARDVCAYFRCFNTVIDIISVLPFYVQAITGIVNGHDPIYAIVPTFPTFFSVLPIMKSIRILKLMRHFQVTSVLIQTALLTWRRLLIPLFFLFLSCVATAAMYYEIERGTQCFVDVACTWWGKELWTRELKGNLPTHKREQIQNDKFTTITDMLRSTYFSIVTFANVGYGDLRVRSPIGKLFDIMVMIFGSFYTAMPLALVGGQFYACYEIYLLDQSGELVNDEVGLKEDHIPKHLVLTPEEIATLKNCQVLVFLLDQMIQDIHKLNSLTPHASFLDTTIDTQLHIHRSNTVQGSLRRVQIQNSSRLQHHSTISELFSKHSPKRRRGNIAYAPADKEQREKYNQIRNRIQASYHHMTTIFFQFTALVEKIAEATHSEKYTDF